MYDNLCVAQSLATILALTLGELAREREDAGDGQDAQAARQLAQAALTLVDEVRVLAAHGGGQP